MKTRKSALNYCWPCLVLLCLVMALPLTGCGNDSTASSKRITPTIVAAKVVEKGVQVIYRAPEADGGDWPVMRISVRETDGVLPAWSEEVRPVEEEGTVVVPMETGPNRTISVYGSIVYEDGERVHLVERRIQS